MDSKALVEPAWLQVIDKSTHVGVFVVEVRHVVHGMERLTQSCCWWRLSAQQSALKQVLLAVVDRG